MILITGSSGLLGPYVVEHLKLIKSNVVTHSYTRGADFCADLTKRDDAFKLMSKVKPTLIINLVGATSVEECEQCPNKAYLMNVRTVENIVSWILEGHHNCHLIHISTDQVYDGDIRHEENNVSLTNTYALTKYAGELVASKVSSTILRTNFVGKSKTNGRESLTDWVYNSIRKGENIQVLDDVLFNPLSMKTVSELLGLVSNLKPQGIFNLGSNGGKSKAQFDIDFASKINLPISKIQRILSKDASFLKAYRPKNMIMDVSRFESMASIKLPTLDEEISSVAKDYLNGK